MWDKVLRIINNHKETKLLEIFVSLFYVITSKHNYIQSRNETKLIKEKYILL